MKLLIFQPAGIGDILYIQKIVKILSKDYDVYLPIKKSISWMCNYLDTVCTFEDCKNIEFYSTLLLDGAHYGTDKFIMRAKYDKAGISSENYLDYISIQRNFDKENILFNKLVKNIPYRLVCPWYGTPEVDGTGSLRMNIPYSSSLNNIVMDMFPEFTLFDWIKIIENAAEIYTTDSAVVFLAEKFNKIASNFVCYSRRKHTKEIDYLFSSKWEYRC